MRQTGCAVILDELGQGCALEAAGQQLGAGGWVWLWQLRCLPQLGLLYQSTTDWVAYRPDIYFWKSEINAPIWLGSGESPLPGRRLPTSRCVLT